MEHLKPTPAESANLILKFFELRREEKMREARNWMWTFKPSSYADFKATVMGPDSAKMRMVLGYWDMGAALVNHGAIDEAMFNDTNGEYVSAYMKIKPFLAEMQAEMPGAFKHLEILAERKLAAQASHKQ